MQQGRFEGIIPFILLFLLLFYAHSKIYDLLAYLYDKIKEKYRKLFPLKLKNEVHEPVQAHEPVQVHETVQESPHEEAKGEG
jgi:hypothetical protein